MARRAYGQDVALKGRMLTTMGLLGLLYVVGFGALGFVFHAQIALWLVIGLGLLTAQIFLSEKIALASARARIVEANEAPELHAIVDRLCIVADLPKPRIAIAPTEMPNAFATGRSRRHATIAVTQGLLDRLQPAELEGVLAHELTHVRNRDVAVMTIASFFAMVAGLLVRSFFWFGFGSFGGGGNDDEDSSGIATIIAIAVAVGVYLVSFLLIRSLSRYREFAADRGAAVITKAPSQLAAALIKISGDVGRIPQNDLRSAEGLAQFYIIPPRVKGSLSALFQTHPPLEARLEQLKRLEAELESI